MTTPSELNGLSVLSLVASDAAYKTLNQYNQDRSGGGPVYLRSFPDSTEGNEVDFPSVLAAGLQNQGLTAHVVDIDSPQRITFTNWTLIKKFQDPTTGFGAAIFKSGIQVDERDHYIVAFQGSDGLDARDWFANIDYARKVWERNGQDVINFLLNGGTGDDEENYAPPSLGWINFTGQSLGGGLAQYGAYFYARAMRQEGVDFDPSTRMALIEFNGFGAVAGIDDLLAREFDGAPPGTRYDKTLLANVPTIHYAIENDLVHRLGTGKPTDLTLLGGSWHVNGADNSYTLNFRRFNDAGENVAGQQNKLNFVDAHRIEAGFYRGFANYRSSFGTATYLERRNYSYIDTHLVQNVGVLLSHMFSDGTSSNLSARARTVLGVLGASAIGPVSEIQGMQRELVRALYDAGEINATERAALSVGTSAITIKAVLIQTAATVSRALGAAGLLFSIGMELFKFLNSSDKQAIVQEENRFLPADRQLQYESVADSEATPGDWVARYETYSVFAAQYAEFDDRWAVVNTSVKQRLAEDLSALDIDALEFGAKVIDGSDWISDTALLVESKLISNNATPEQWARTTADLTAFFAEEAEDIGAHDPVAAGRMLQVLEVFARDAIGKALGSTKEGFIARDAPILANVFEGRSLNFDEYNRYRNALFDVVNDRSIRSARPYLQAALREIDNAGQSVEIRVATASNPFGDPTFDPQTMPSLTSEIKEGHSRFYTAYLPYAAAEGGQRIRFRLDGIANDTFSVVDGANTVELTENGEFDLVVPEGQRQVAFALTQLGDIDSGSSLTLSTTLIDVQGRPSHQAKMGVTLALNTVEEPSDPVTTSLMELLSAGGAEGPGAQYFDTPDPDRIFIREDSDSANDYLNYDALAFFANQFGGRPSGSSDWVSTFGGRDVVYLGAGDDLIESGTGGIVLGDAGGDIVHAGSGNDRIYGNEIVDTELAIAEGEAGEASMQQGDALSGGVGDDLAIGTADRDLLSGGGGADVLIGGAGNDYLLGDTDYETRTFNWGVSVDGAGTDNRSYEFFVFREVEVLPDPQGDRLYGGAGDDVAFGEGGDDFIDLGAGSDHGIGGDGEDVVLGGAGEDLLVGEDDGDFLDGGEDADRLFGAEGSDVLYGGGGDDFLQGDSDDAGAGEDYLDGEDGNDVLVGGGLSDVLYGGAGDDELHGDGANVDLSLQSADELFGEEGNDVLVGHAGDDILDGGEGDDVLAGGEGIDELSGGEGNDQIFGDDDEDDEGGGDADFIDGGAGDDWIEAHGGDDFVLAGEGNDFVDAGNGSDYVEAGEGDDHVVGGSGDDELIGGGGDDSLRGGAGADIYRYSLGDGIDQISENGDAGPGVIDTLSFGAGIAAEDVSFSRDWFGNLAIRLADGGEVAISGLYSDPWNRIERITFEDGTVLTAAELDDLPIGVIFGTDGDDTLEGSENVDTLAAGAGDDFLDGGRGNDVLDGGAGIDTYSIGLSSGLDTIVEAAGETSVVVLGAGLSLQDLRAARGGDDLTLTVRGTGNAVTIRDYFSAAQEISVHDAAGTSLSAAQLLEISGSEQQTRETLKADFRVRAKVDFFSRHFADGYQFVDANTAARTSTNPVVVGVDRAETSSQTSITYFDGRPGVSFSSSDSRIELRPIMPGSVLHETLQYVHRLTESDDELIQVDSQDGVAEAYSEQPVHLDWDEGQEILLSLRQRVETTSVFDPEAPPGSQAIGIARTTHDDFSFSRVATGWIVAAPGDRPPYLPASEIVDRTDVTVTQTLNEVLAGPGDNTIWGAYIADGGAGNDSISGDGLLLGGEGDDSLFGTGSLYGEDGNDSITGSGYLDGGHGDDEFFSFEAALMAPGSGHDVVWGGSGKDVVRIGPDDTGIKLLWDYGSVADYDGEGGIPFFDRHYESLGISNWRQVALLPTVSADDYDLLAPVYDYEFYPTDVVELPEAATLGDLEVAWGFFDLDGVQLTLDLSWGTQTTVRIVLPNPSQSTPDDFPELIGNGFERVRLGGGVELGVGQLVALAPATLPRRQVVGTEFDDSLFGWQGDDDLRGMAGNDQLEGDGGDDRYHYSSGDGTDSISDTGGADAVVFGEGIAPEDVLVTRDPYGTLYLEVGGPQNRLHLNNWFTSDGQIEHVEFASGLAWDAAEIESRITTAPATELSDILNAGDGDDVIDALAGDDAVYGNAGNDILAGGEGNDSLEGNHGSNLLQGGAGEDGLAAGNEPGLHLFIGGAGDDFIATGAAGDIVAFNAGDGHDTIFAVDALTLSLGGGIGAADLSLTDDFGLVLNVAGGDSIRFWSQPQITLQLFGSVHTYDLSAAINEFYAQWNGEPGAVFSLADVLPVYQTGSSETEALGGAIAWQYATAGSTDGLTSAQIRSVLADPGFGVAAQPIVLEEETNQAPVAGAIADRSTDEDAAVAFSVADAFSDPDAGDALAYAVATVDGAPLPAWLSFDQGSAAFSGTPGNADVGSIGIRVTATDAAGLSAQADFDLTVLNVNDAPTLAHAIADQSFAAGAAFTFALPADTFADEDATDTLSLSARLAGGGALPAWLTFDPASGAFSGSPQAANIGVLHLEVTATDAAGEAIADDFGLVVRAPDGATVNGRKGDDVINGGSGDETLIAKGGSDYVYGDAGDDVLRGGGGNDVLQGGEGADELRSGSGQNLLDGGAGNDVLHGGQGSAFLAGGAGNDEIRVGRGNDVIAFNAGDGIDTLYGGRDGGNTLSFGGGIGYDDLSFSKSGHDLVVNAGENDRMVLKNWYRGNHSVQSLQVILDATAEYDAASEDDLYNKRVQIFDMWSLVAQFNQALAANPELDSWSIMNGIANAGAQVQSSDDSALGGDLAYWYGRNRTLAGISLAAAQEILGAPGFGSDAQSLRPFEGLQEGFVRLR